MVLNEKLDALTRDEETTLKMISEWDCDGYTHASSTQEFEVFADSDGNVF